MHSVIKESLPWVSPLAAAEGLGAKEECWVLLYSGQQLLHTGRYSYLALYPQEKISGDDFAQLAEKLTHDKQALENAWFGYFGYEMLHRTETLPRESKEYIPLPQLWFARFGMILQFDHEMQTVTCLRAPDVAAPAWPPAGSAHRTLPQVTSLTSPMTRETYLAHVAKTKEAIARGDFYQANITRKFTGEFETVPDAFALFCALCETSPAAYSAFIKMNGTAILSSSPERFLTVDAKGHMETRPIKGTAPRSKDAAEDAALRTALEKSEKDRAENLMIVDLMRNDLARSAVAGSVRVEKLFEVSSYATLHHMASTVSGEKRADVTTLEAVRGAFPPGSMTGTPKIRAIEWCMEQEQIRRGIYSGALGWFGGDGSCDLSVVIRTLVLEGKRFEFQVGGAIVSDSDPHSEWQETITKARGVMAALGVDIKRLEEI